MSIVKFPQTMESECIWANDTTVTSATATITGSGSQMNFFMGTSSAIDGTYNWEGPITSGITHNFTNTGKFIKWKAVGLQYTITRIEIKINQ